MQILRLMSNFSFPINWNLPSNCYITAQPPPPLSALGKLASNQRFSRERSINFWDKFWVTFILRAKGKLKKFFLQPKATRRNLIFFSHSLCDFTTWKILFRNKIHSGSLCLPVPAFSERGVSWPAHHVRVSRQIPTPTALEAPQGRPRKVYQKVTYLPSDAAAGCCCCCGCLHRNGIKRCEINKCQERERKVLKKVSRFLCSPLCVGSGWNFLIPALHVWSS